MLEPGGIQEEIPVLGLVPRVFEGSHTPNHKGEPGGERKHSADARRAQFIYDFDKAGDKTEKKNHKMTLKNRANHKS